MRGTNKITKLKNLVVREVSFVNNPAIPDAKFVIVKEADEIEKSPSQSGTAPLGCPDDPVASNEVIDDGGKAELQAVVKQLVDKSSGLPDGMQDLIAKIAKFHGIDPYTPEMLEAAKPKDPTPVVAAGADVPSTTKEATECSPATAEKAVTLEQVRGLFAEMMASEPWKMHVKKSDPEPTPEGSEVPETTGAEGTDPEIDVLLRASEMLKKEEQDKSQLSELEMLNAQRDALNTSVSLLKSKSQELRRELLKAMGKDPNENSVIA